MMDEIKQQILAMGVQMASSCLVVGTWGNVSARVPGQDHYIVTPSGIPYDRCRPGDLVVVDSHGRVVQGGRRPSTELDLHLAIYNARADVGAVMHTHSVYASALAVAGQPLPAILEELVQLAGGGVPVTRYARAGTADLARAVLEVLDDHQAVLLANHGLVGLGRNLEEALLVCLVVEKAAQVYLLSRLLGPAQIIPPAEVDSLRNAYLTSYGQPKK